MSEKEKKDFILTRYGTIIDKLRKSEELDDNENFTVNMTCDLFIQNMKEGKVISQGFLDKMSIKWPKIEE